MTEEAEQSPTRRTPRVVHPRVELTDSAHTSRPQPAEAPDPGPRSDGRPRLESGTRHGELRQVEVVQGGHPGDRYARIRRWRDFQRVKAGHLRLGSGVGQSKGPIGRTYAQVKRLLVGRPLASHEEPHERVNVFTGLAVFASDNISSSAYATEEIMRVLVLAGLGTLALTLPISRAD